jgi:hypothetical protein
LIFNGGKKLTGPGKNKKMKIERRENIQRDFLSPLFQAATDSF